MCGLVGMVGNVDHEMKGVFKKLLKLDTVRGPHSTGVLSVTKDLSEYTLAKAVGTPWDLDVAEDMDSVYALNKSLLIGHNRFSTVGKTCRDNAHPFVCGDYIGCHNGTLKNKWALEGHSKFDTDSEALYNHININGLEDALVTANGAYALTFFKNTSEERSFNMVRNVERPLVYCISPDKKTLVWASESWMLLVALQELKEDWDSPKEVKADTLYTIDMDSINSGEELVVKRTKVKGYVAPYVAPKSTDWYSEQGTGNVKHAQHNTYVAHHKKKIGDEVTFKVNGFGNFNNVPYIKGKVEGDEFICVRSFTASNNLNYSRMQVNTTWVARVNALGNNFGDKYYKVDQRTLRQIYPVAEVPEEKKSTDLVYGAIYKGFEGIRLSKSGLLNMTANHCGWCASPFDFNVHDHKKLFWTDTKEFICHGCQTHLEVVELYPQLAEN